MRAIIVIKGIKPLSKQHGTGRFGNRYFTKPKYKEFKDFFSWEAKKQLAQQGWKCIKDNPVWLSVVFKSNKNIGDISNLLGGIEDALEGIAFENDCQVFLRSCYGMLTDEPKFVETRIKLELESQFYRSEIDWIKDGLKKRRKKRAARMVAGENLKGGEK